MLDRNPVLDRNPSGKEDAAVEEGTLLWAEARRANSQHKNQRKASTRHTSFTQSVWIQKFGSRTAVFHQGWQEGRCPTRRPRSAAPCPPRRPAGRRWHEPAAASSPPPGAPGKRQSAGQSCPGSWHPPLGRAETKKMRDGLTLCPEQGGNTQKCPRVCALLAALLASSSQLTLSQNIWEGEGDSTFSKEGRSERTELGAL